MTRNDSRSGKSLWWVYFGLLALAWFASLFDIHSLFDALLALFYGYGLVGLWGYLRDVAIGWRIFWATYLILFSAAVLYSIGLIAWFALQTSSGMLYAILVAGILLCIPQCVALWRYSFRSALLWQTAPVAA